jgi:hypothetical protein
MAAARRMVANLVGDDQVRIPAESRDVFRLTIESDEGRALVLLDLEGGGGYDYWFRSLEEALSFCRDEIGVPDEVWTTVES